MENNNLTDRRYDLDILRIFATFIVVMLHVSGEYWYDVEFNTPGFNAVEWNIFNIYDGLCRWCVPVFVMISGALFLRRDHSIEKLYKKNILRMFTAFYSWSTIYAVFTYLQGYPLRKALICLIKGYYHMWFIFMMAGLYMIVPFLRKIVVDRKLMRYFLVLGFIFSFVIPQTVEFVKLFSIRYNIHLYELFDEFYFRFATGFSFYFVLGYFLDTIKFTKKQTRIIYCIGLLGIVGTVGATTVLVYTTGYLNELFYRNFTVNVLIESVFVFILFKNLFGNVKFSEKASRIIYKLSKYSFGAYLIHAMLIIIFGNLGLSAISFNPAGAVPVISILVFVASYLISFILNQIPIVKKYMV